METSGVTNRHLSEAELIRMRLHALWDHHDGGNLSHFLEGLAEAVEKKAWEKLNLSFQEFVSSPAPDGLDIPMEQFKAAYHIRHRKEKNVPTAVERYSKMREEVRDLLNPELAKKEIGQGKPGPGRGNKTGDNITRFSDRGTSESYTIRRLKRDRPELAEKVISGEISANAAAIQAGFRKKTLTVPADVRAAARVLVKHFDAQELCEALIEAGEL